MSGILNVSAIGTAMKDWYLPGMRVQINEETDALWAELEKNTEMVQGGRIVMSLRYGRSGGVGSRDDDGDLPEANARKSVPVNFNTKNTFARMKITTKAIEISRSDRGAFASMLEQTLDDLMVDAKDNAQRQLYGDGTGKITTLSDTAASATHTVASTVGLFEGQLVDVLVAANTVKSAGLEIIAVNDDTNAVTFSASFTAAGGDYLTIAGSYNKEMTGIQAIFTPGNILYGLDRSTNPFFNPTTHAISGEIAETEIQKGLDKARNRTGVRHDFLITSHGVLRAYQNLMVGKRTWNDTLTLKGGFEAPTYRDGHGNVLPLIAAKYHPSGKMRGISRQNFKLTWLGDWAWMESDGAVLARISGKPAYEATLQLFADLCCDVPRGQVEFTGITEH